MPPPSPAGRTKKMSFRYIYDKVLAYYNATISSYYHVLWQYIDIIANNNVKCMKYYFANSTVIRYFVQTITLNVFSTVLTFLYSVLRYGI